MTAGAIPEATIRNERLRLRLKAIRSFARRFTNRPDGVLGVLVLLVFVILAVAPNLFVGDLQTATTASGASLDPPSATHLLGTDELGRDILNLTIHGTRISMIIGLLATIVTILLGVFVGIVSGYVGGRVDVFLMRITDFFLVLPTFVLALILAPIILDLIGANSSVFGIRVTLLVIVVVIGVTSWASTARIIRSQTLSVKERAFVGRARVIGSGGGHIMWRHILPNVMNLIVANTVLVFGGSILTETTLSFIGLGDPFAPSWGQVLNAAESAGALGLGAWWYVVPPAVCIVLVVLSFTLVGSALDDVLNPRLRVRR